MEKSLLGLFVKVAVHRVCQWQHFPGVEQWTTESHVGLLDWRVFAVGGTHTLRFNQWHNWCRSKNRCAYYYCLGEHVISHRAATLLFNCTNSNDGCFSFHAQKLEGLTGNSVLCWKQHEENKTRKPFRNWFRTEIINELESIKKYFIIIFL